MSKGKPSEARLDEIRREAAEKGRLGTAGPGPYTGARESAGYYGHPILKPPVWTWEIPAYFFVGGLAGAAAIVAFAATALADRPGLASAAAWTAVAGAVASTALLVMDLGRSTRFLFMLRVFKWRSPMSVGAWVLTAFGGAATAGAVLLAWSRGGGAPPTWLVSLALGVVAALGSVLATYTGVLIGATVIPAWLTHRLLLPIHFGIAGMGSAAALLEILGYRITPLHVVGLVAAGAETLVGATVELRRRGPADSALRQGSAGWLLRGGGLFAGPGALAFRIFGLRIVAASLFLAGTAASRFGWVRAGGPSARDPRATMAVHGR